MGALGGLQERVVLKWETDTMEDKPDNVELVTFLPQQVKELSHCARP